MAGRHARRRATVYLLVLMTTAIVGVTGVTALMVARLQRRTVHDADRYSAARFAAQSAIDFGVFSIAADPGWRTRFSSGGVYKAHAVGGATFSLYGADPVDGDLTDWPYDPLVLTAVGVAAPARYALQATLEPERTPLPILASAVHAAGGITVSAGVTLTATGGPVSTNATLTYNSATVAGDVECLLAVGLLGTITGTTTILSIGKTMPPASVVTMYANAATAIPGGVTTLSKAVIGPGYTPWGVTNADGLYVISTGSDVNISDSRVEGTLVINCPGRTVKISSSVLMHNYRSDFPALIVNGNLELEFTGGSNTFSEAAVGANLNPAGAPYAGLTDGDLTDVYPSELQGLVHVTGTVRFKSAAPRLRGALIVGSAALLDAVLVDVNSTLIHDDAVYDNPPLGYEATLEMRPTPGSWAPVAAP